MEFLKLHLATCLPPPPAEVCDTGQEHDEVEFVGSITHNTLAIPRYDANIDYYQEDLSVAISQLEAGLYLRILSAGWSIPADEDTTSIDIDDPTDTVLRVLEASSPWLIEDQRKAFLSAATSYVNSLRKIIRAQHKWQSSISAAESRLQWDSYEETWRARTGSYTPWVSVSGCRRFDVSAFMKEPPTPGATTTVTSQVLISSAINLIEHWKRDNNEAVEGIQDVVAERDTVSAQAATDQEIFTSTGRREQGVEHEAHIVIPWQGLLPQFAESDGGHPVYATERLPNLAAMLSYFSDDGCLHRHPNAGARHIERKCAMDRSTYGDLIDKKHGWSMEDL